MEAAKTEAETRLNQLHARISAWRRTRQRYERMPAVFWNEATALGGELGATAVQQTLAINRAALLRRMEQDEQARGHEEPPVFVELPRMAREVAPGSVIELEDSTGLRLTLRLQPGAVLDLAQVVSAFRGTR